MCVLAIPESSGGPYSGTETPGYPYCCSHAGNLRAFKVVVQAKDKQLRRLANDKDDKMWRRRESNPGPETVHYGRLHVYSVFKFTLTHTHGQVLVRGVILKISCLYQDDKIQTPAY